MSACWDEEKLYYSGKLSQLGLFRKSHLFLKSISPLPTFSFEQKDIAMVLLSLTLLLP